MYIDEIYAARDYIQSRYKNPIDVAIVLGSGLGPLADVINEPVEIAFARFSIVGLAIELTSLAADIIVIVILVPVSPSGTGNTLRSFIHSFFDSRFLAPARNIFWTSAASIVLVATIFLHSADTTANDKLYVCLQ